MSGKAKKVVKKKGKVTPPLQESGPEFVPKAGAFDNLGDKVELRTERVLCPELNDVLAPPEGQVVTFVVTQCNLSVYLRLQGERHGATQTFVDGLTKALRSEDSDEVGKVLKQQFWGDGEELSPQAKFEVDICRECVLEPKLRHSVWLSLSNLFPMIVNRLANQIVDLTLKGGIKKN